MAYWSTSTATNATFSIPALVERTGLDLRREYLAWVHDLGNIPVNGSPLKDLLFLDAPDLSAWWLNTVADKAPLNSTSIYQTFKLRALEKLYIEQKCTGLVYCGRDPRLHRILKSWCGGLRHSYRWMKGAPQPKRSALSVAHRGFRKLPYLAQALTFLTWKLYTRYVPTWVRGWRMTHASDGGDRAVIVTYFPNIDLDEARQGRFRSAYWGPLHDLLDELPLTPTWIWIYGDTDQCDFRQALSWRDRFNAHSTRKDRHFLLEDFATPKALLVAIQSYLRLYARGLRMKSVRDKFVLPGSTLNFYPLFEREWNSSLFGPAAIDGQLYRALFDSMTHRLPAQRWCLYIWENQPWEAALLTAWRRYQKGSVIGYQHATVMPLELRAICDPRTYREKGRAARPLPDVLAINGRGALELFREVQYPEDRLAVVEALRYPRLSRRTGREHGDPGTLLVVAGYLESEARLLIRVLNEAADAIQSAGYVKIRIKAHPFGPARMRSRHLPLKLAYDVVSEPLEGLWHHADFALIANSTSAAVEAVLAGVPLAICASVDNVNLSPLYGHPGVPFVCSGRELAAVLAAARCALLPADYFLISERPTRWKELLSTSTDHTAPVAGRGLPT